MLQQARVSVSHSHSRTALWTERNQPAKCERDLQRQRATPQLTFKPPLNRSACEWAKKKYTQANTTVELSQTLRERLKERHDSIGLMSRRRCSAMGISALARASASASRPSPSYGGSGGGTASNGTATSPTNLSGHAVNAHLATSVSPTGPVLPVVVTASSSSKVRSLFLLIRYPR